MQGLQIALFTRLSPTFEVFYCPDVAALIPSVLILQPLCLSGNWDFSDSSTKFHVA